MSDKLNNEENYIVQRRIESILYTQLTEPVLMLIKIYKVKTVKYPSLADAEACSK